MSRAICQDPSTWDADWALSASYWAAYFSVDGADRLRLRDGHVAWFKTVEDGCGLTANVGGDPGRAAPCVAKRYRARAAFYRNTLSGDALAEATLRPEELLAIQVRLAAMGFMAGEADGVFGAGTRQAIRAYRQTLGHPPSDFLDAQERTALLRTTPAGPDRGRNPFGETVPQARPAIPDPRFARDPFGQGFGGPRTGPPAALPGILMDMLGGVPPRGRSASDYVERRRPSTFPSDGGPDEFGGSGRFANVPAGPTPGQARGGARSASEFSDGDTAVLAGPLGGRPAPEADPGVRTVEVKGTGENPDAARKDAARLAIQQVVGVFVDNRRRVELNVSDRKVTEIVDEKLISYTNAYVSKLEVVRTEQRGGLYEVTARVGVAVKPLLKVLQDNAVPVVAFDTATAASTVETLGQEKAAATDLYADLVAKADGLIRVGVGTPQVDVGLPSSADEAWLRIPLTYGVNDDAVREWRAKFDLIAQKRAQVFVRLDRPDRGRPGQAICRPPAFDVGFTRGFGAGERTFLSERTPSEQLGVAACFASYQTPDGVMAECLGRTFVTNERYSQRCPPEGPCLHFDQRAQRLRLVVEFLDKEGAVVFASRQPFRSYPSLRYDDSRTAPQGQERGFFNYCVPAQQDPFFAVTSHAMGTSFGDVLVFPERGSRVRGYLNLLLPNATIARIASVRARIAWDAS
ncbi:peptidoglycan-binding protein [Methylorubrum populi]|uniref:peptidoglycan-binding domain-containing protein n=1 Tax=Methylorubrum rhodesianum TaxID=29427 RepID=UPI00190B9620|nr:peptidoglycan-binding domain-containing protein [Methylorubrum rhodesianum]MBK3404170.1 peptidoglycan-binding protein [Methylorubrum rhodesianum]MBY0142960.1 peptidoglycan-binding protein [Methylorubrum populi]